MNETVHSAPGKTARTAKADIIDVATREFAEKGLAGARIDVIAGAMRTRKRMSCGNAAGASASLGKMALTAR
jgi:hypothetical protein